MFQVVFCNYICYGDGENKRKKIAQITVKLEDQ